MKPDIFWLVGVPVGTPGYVQGAGYTPDDCWICAQPIWVGPTMKHEQRRLSAEGKLFAVACPQCAIEQFPAGAVPTVTVLNPNSGSTFDRGEYERVTKGGK